MEREQAAQEKGIAEGIAPEPSLGSQLPDNNNGVFVIVYNSFCIQLMTWVIWAVFTTLLLTQSSLYSATVMIMTHITHIVPWKHGHPCHPLIRSVLVYSHPCASLQSPMLRHVAGLATSGFRGIALHVGLDLLFQHHQVSWNLQSSPSSSWTLLTNMLPVLVHDNRCDQVVPAAAAKLKRRLLIQMGD